MHSPHNFDKFKTSPHVIGITGGIGAGKSVVSRLLRLSGYSVYDCDSHARRIMDEDEKLRQEIAERLGKECVGMDGSINRSAVADAIFSDDEARLWLNSKVHSAVTRDFCLYASTLAGYSKVFIEAAVLRSSALWRLCDEIWIVDAPADLRIMRVMERNGLSQEAIRARMESQKVEFDFTGLPDAPPTWFILNDGVTPLLPQVSRALDSHSQSL